MLERRYATDRDGTSERATTTFEVPLFLSPTRYEPSRAYDDGRIDEDTRSRSSTQSLIETAHSIADRVRPLSLPASSQYSSQPASPALPQPAILPFHETSLLASVQTSECSSTSRRSPKKAPMHRRRKRRSSTKMKIQALTRLSIAFGFTLFVTLITYLVLAVTSTASGIMFHVLMILLILSLTGVFAHSIIRRFTLAKSAKGRRNADRRRVPRWHGQEVQHDESYFGEIQHDTIEHDEEAIPEKPIRIIMAEDEDTAYHHVSPTRNVQQPPPVYGNFRTSKRINPDFVHWQKLPPSPLTPTYDEAISDVHRVVGYRPPSYIESESGATRIVEQGQRDVDFALKNIHPLERQRMAELSRNAI